MLKNVLLISFVLLNMKNFSQDFKITVDEKTGEPLILGYCPVSQMNDSVFSNTWTVEYENYQPDFETLDMLEGKLNDTVIQIVFRSTCSDSREQLPRFFKILNELN